MSTQFSPCSGHTHIRTCPSFDLNYKPVTFSDCVLYGCDSIAVTKSVSRQVGETDRQTDKLKIVTAMPEWEGMIGTV